MTADSSILKQEPQETEIKEALLFAEEYNKDDIKVFDHEYWTEHLDFDPFTVRMC